MRVAVIGAGIVGLSAARFLCARGHSVTLYEQFDLFHDKGSSHGRSRIVRRAYPDRFYTQCMLEAYPLWADLEREAGEQLVREVGLLYFGSRDSARMTSMEAGLSECQVPYQVLMRGDLSNIFPALHLHPGEVGIFTPEAGWVDAERALKCSFGIARANGLAVSHEFATPADLEQSYDVVLLAPGAWITKFVDVSVKVTVETFGYADLHVEGPVWIDDTDFCYGFPSDEQGLKLGAHLRGYETDPAKLSREPDPELQRMLENKVKERFAAEVPIRHWKGCLYTSTATEDFIVGRLGDNCFYASACSGHGFKTGPWIGKLLADFAEGKDRPENHPRFCSN